MGKKFGARPIMKVMNKGCAMATFVRSNEVIFPGCFSA